MESPVIKNYIYNIGYQLLILVLPLITTPYISRVLGADNIGAFGYTESITQYFVLFGCIGLNLYGQREIAYCQKSESDRTNIFFELFFVRLITVSVVMFIFYFTVCHNKKYGKLFIIQLIELGASMIDVSWFFQGMEEFKKIVVRNAFVKIIGVILIFSLVKQVDDLTKYTAIYVITLFLGNISMLLYLPRYVKRVEIRTLKIVRHIKPAIILFIPQVATNIYNLLDKSMIGFLTNMDTEVAYYEQAQKIVKMALSIPTALGTVMLPRIASMFGERKNQEIKEYLYKSIRFVCMLTFPLCMGVCVIASGFVPWFFGDGYVKVGDNLIILAPIIIIVGISNVIGVQYLLPVGKQKQYTYSVVLGTIVNFTLNILMIPLLMSCGAAIASVIAELSVAIFQLIMVKNEFQIKVIIKSILIYITSSTIMFSVVFIVSLFLNHSKPYETLLEIFLGSLIYIILLIVLKDDMVYDGFIKIKNRFKK